MVTAEFIRNAAQQRSTGRHTFEGMDTFSWEGEAKRLRDSAARWRTDYMEAGDEATLISTVLHVLDTNYFATVEGQKRYCQGYA